MLTFSKTLLLSSAVIITTLLTACSEPEAKEEDKEVVAFAVPVMVASIERKDISSNFHTTATLESRNEAEIITRVTGIIEEPPATFTPFSKCECTRCRWRRRQHRSAIRWLEHHLARHG